jgi:Glycosyl transferase family 90
MTEIVSDQNCIYVIHTASGPREIAVKDVPTAEWGYFLFDEFSCQLNASDHSAPPATLTAEIDLIGQYVFESEVAVDNPLGFGVTFGVAIQHASDGHSVAQTSVDVAAGARERLVVPLGGLRDRCRITLWTQMMPSALTNHHVRSYWLAPRFRKALPEHAPTGRMRAAPPGERAKVLPFDGRDLWLDLLAPLLERRGGWAHQRIPVQWSVAQRSYLEQISRNEIASHSVMDPILADPLLRCAGGDFAGAEEMILILLRRHLDLCRRDSEVFISFLGAAFVMQRFDVVAALLRARYDFPCELEIAVHEGPGRGRIRWDIQSCGAHRFSFDVKAFESDRTHHEIRTFQWEFPLFAQYAKQQDQEVGSVIINQGDVGETPGIAYCDSRPEYFLVPDYIFTPTHGYRYERQILREKRIPWQQRTPVAFWRGATTGVAATPGDWRSLERIKLCELARRHATTGLIDAGLSTIVQFADPAVRREIEESGLVRGRVPWQEWGRYRYHIDIDGNSSPWSNTFQKLLTGSSILKVESTRGLRMWFYDELVPWQNYVPVAPDLSDLVDKIRWLARNDGVAQRIGECGNELAQRLTYEREIDRGVGVISAAFRYFNGRAKGVGPYGCTDTREFAAKPSDDSSSRLSDEV